MILDDDNEVVENVNDTLPISGDFLDSLGFIGVGQLDSYSNVFNYRHRTYECKLEVFHYYADIWKEKSVLDNVYPDGTLIVRTWLVDPVTREPIPVHFASQNQLENYVKYLEKMHEINRLQYEVHDLLEEKIVPKLKTS